MLLCLATLVSAYQALQVSTVNRTSKSARAVPVSLGPALTKSGNTIVIVRTVLKEKTVKLILTNVTYTRKLYLLFFLTLPIVCKSFPIFLAYRLHFSHKFNFELLY